MHENNMGKLLSQYIAYLLWYSVGAFMMGVCNSLVIVLFAVSVPDPRCRATFFSTRDIMKRWDDMGT
jgi:hypothetical protein